jgi:hypothetical protein
MSGHSPSEVGTLRAQENDYDSDADQIAKATEKLRRDLRQAITEELDRGLQGLYRISDCQNSTDEKGPLSSRLRKRKLNSA